MLQQLIDDMLPETRALFVEEVMPQMEWITSKHALERAEAAQGEAAGLLRDSELELDEARDDLEDAQEVLDTPGSLEAAATPFGATAAAAAPAATTDTDAVAEEGEAEDEKEEMKQLRECQRRVIEAEEEVLRNRAALASATADVAAPRAVVEEVSRRRPFTTLFDPLPLPRPPRMRGDKRRRKQGGGKLGCSRHEGTDLDATPGSSSSSPLLRQCLRPRRAHQLMKASHIAREGPAQQPVSPFLCLLGGGHHTDALANIVAFVHGIKQRHADMDAALKGSLGLTCQGHSTSP